MRTRVLVTSMMLSATLAAPALAATIDTTPLDTSACCFGEFHPQGNFYFGQSFVALGSRIGDFTLYALDNYSELYPGTYDFSVLLVAGQLNAAGTRTLLFESPVYSIGFVPGGAFTEISPDLSSVPLVPGENYSWVLDSYVTRNGILDVGQLGLKGNNPYPSGSAFARSASGAGRNADLNGSWYSVSNYDAAFEMTFVSVVSEPTTLALLGLGLAGLGFSRRK